jgi:hypothetical protein
VSNGLQLAFLAKYGEVLSRTFAGDRAIVHCRLSRKHLGTIREDRSVDVRPYDMAAAVARNGQASDEAVGEVA